jgi:hypothetical protein
VAVEDQKEAAMLNIQKCLRSGQAARALALLRASRSGKTHPSARYSVPVSFCMDLPDPYVKGGRHSQHTEVSAERPGGQGPRTPQGLQVRQNTRLPGVPASFWTSRIRNYLYGSRSFHKQEFFLYKIMISSVKQKNLERNLFFAGILKATEEKTGILIRSWICFSNGSDPRIRILI